MPFDECGKNNIFTRIAQYILIKPDRKDNTNFT